MDKPAVFQIGGSIEKAVQGEYEIDIKNVLSEAWQLTKTSRAAINIGLSTSIFLGVIVAFIASFYLGGIENVLNDPQATMILNIVVTLVIWPFLAGVEMMGVLQSIGMKVKATLIFTFLKRGSWVAICALLTSILISLGIQLLVIPGIFLGVTLSLTIPLVVEKKMTPMQAINISIRALRFKFFQILGIYFFLLVIFIALTLPLFILGDSSVAFIAIVLFFFGLSYLAPLFYCVKGILYREIFGLKVAMSKENEHLLSNKTNIENSSDSGSDDIFSA